MFSKGLLWSYEHHRVFRRDAETDPRDAGATPETAVGWPSWAQNFMRKWLISRVSHTEKRIQELTAKGAKGASALPSSLHPF